VQQCPTLNGPFLFGGNNGDLWADPTAAGRLIKKFKQVLSDSESRKLVELNSLLYRIRPSDRETLKQNFAWPIELYGQPHAITAIAIPLAPSDFYMDIQYFGTTETRLLELSLLVDREFWQQPNVDTPEPRIPIESRIELCFSMLTTLITLWEAGGNYGDFSYKNLIWALTPTPRIMFLDADTATADINFDRKMVSPYFSEHLIDGSSARQKDLRLAALVIWRIFSQKLRSHPDDQVYSNSLNQVNSEVRLAIQRLWTEMTIESAHELHATLHKNRDDRFIKALLINAQKDGLARHALINVPRSPSKSESAFLKLAQDWLKNEEIYLNKRGRSQTRFGRLIYQNSGGLVLDVNNAPNLIDVSKTESFVEAFRDGDFALIAENFNQFDRLSPLIQFVTRAVEHALIEEPVPSVTFIQDQDHCEFQWVFPSITSWINRAVVTIRDQSGTVINQQVYNQQLTRRNVRFQRSRQIVSVSIGWRAETDSGIHVDSPNCWTATVSASTVIPATTQIPTKDHSNTRPRISLETQSTYTRQLPDVQAVPPTRVAPITSNMVRQAPQRNSAIIKNRLLSRFRSFSRKYLTRTGK